MKTNPVKTNANSVLEYFQENPSASISEISDKTGISKSSVQRYLNHPDIVGFTIKLTGKTVKEQLEQNMLLGRSKGGKNTFSKYDHVKNKDGRFSGLVETNTENKEEQKKADIKKIVIFFSKYPYYTIEELSKELGYESSDYVYDCLTDNSVNEMMGSVISESIKAQLDKNKFNIFKKLVPDFDISRLNEFDLSEREAKVIMARLGNDDIKSADEVAEAMNISRTMVLKIENRAIDKINDFIIGRSQR
jgi:DNA-directed RNA polymerase, sigma subunit (sigma70/sigma32)